MGRPRVRFTVRGLMAAAALSSAAARWAARPHPRYALGSARRLVHRSDGSVTTLPGPPRFRGNARVRLADRPGGGTGCDLTARPGAAAPAVRPPAIPLGGAAP